MKRKSLVGRKVLFVGKVVDTGRMGFEVELNGQPRLTWIPKSAISRQSKTRRAEKKGRAK